MTLDEAASFDRGEQGAARAGGPDVLTLHFLAGSRVGTSITLERGAAQLGRQKDMDVSFDPHVDVSVSGRHASIALREGGWWIEDHDASNGTLVNRQRVQEPMRLRSGDVVDLGRQQDQQGEGYVTFGVIEGRSGPVDPSRFEVLVFPCTACQSSLAATVHQSGTEVACKECRTKTEVPEPGGSPEEAAAPALSTGPLGVWDGLKRRFAGFREARRVAAELEQVQAEVAAARRHADREAARFARSLWETGTDEVAGLPAAKALAKWDRERSELRQEVVDLGARQAARGKELEDRRAAWEVETRPLRTAVEEAGADKARDDGRLAESQGEVTSLFSERLAPVGDAAGRVAEVINSNLEDPKDGVGDELPSLVTGLQAACDGLRPDWDRIRSALAQRAERRSDAQEAETALRGAQEKLAEAEQARAATEAAAANDRAGVDDQIRQGRASIEALDDRFRDELRDLGREAVAHDIAPARSHPDYDATCESLKGLKTLEARAADLAAELERLRDSRR